MCEHVHVRSIVAFVLSKAQLCEGAYDLKICGISFAIPGLKISLAPKTQVKSVIDQPLSLKFTLLMY